MRIALDTNILVYAEGVNGDERRNRITSVLRTYSDDEFVVPVQVLGEFFSVLTRKAGWPAVRAQAAMREWRDMCVVVDSSASVLWEATDIACRHGFAMWDSIILAASAQSGCQLLLSEDMHAGFIWRGVEILNPYRN